MSDPLAKTSSIDDESTPSMARQNVESCYILPSMMDDAGKARHGVKLIRKRLYVSSSRDRVLINLNSNIDFIPHLNMNLRLSIVYSKGSLCISSKSKQFIEDVAAER